jgi:hypothetical protein
LWGGRLPKKIEDHYLAGEVARAAWIEVKPKQEEAILNV